MSIRKLLLPAAAILALAGAAFSVTASAAETTPGTQCEPGKPHCYGPLNLLIDRLLRQLP